MRKASKHEECRLFVLLPAEVCTLSNLMMNSQAITKAEAEPTQGSLIRWVGDYREVRNCCLLLCRHRKQEHVGWQIKEIEIVRG